MPEARIQARTSRRLAAPPEQVFDAWLDPSAIRTWLGAALREFGLPGDVRHVAVDARAGGAFTLSDMRTDGIAVHWGTYLVVDRPRELGFTWFTTEEEERENASAVTLTIAADGAGSAAVIVHELHPRWEPYVERVERSWGSMLEHVGRTSAASRTPTTDDA
jgi:uncharacterized protein YndB with AHSA1/START domain